MLEPKRAVTFAGSDSSGCAGLQADLRTWQNLGIHGLSVITAITAQTVDSVTYLEALAEKAIRLQFEAAVAVGFAAGKIGMLGNAQNLILAARLWKDFPNTPLVVDPVRASSSGQAFLSDPALEALKNQLLPVAHVVTPNHPEAEWLVGRKLSRQSDWEEAGREIQSWGATTVLIKGGHQSFAEQIQDLVVDSTGCQWLSAPPLPNRNSRGTGCVLSAAIAGFLAQGASSFEAIVGARKTVREAIRKGYSINEQPGPCGQFPAVNG